MVVHMIILVINMIKKLLWMTSEVIFMSKINLRSMVFIIQSMKIIICQMPSKVLCLFVFFRRGAFAVFCKKLFQFFQLILISHDFRPCFIASIGIVI